MMGCVESLRRDCCLGDQRMGWDMRGIQQTTGRGFERDRMEKEPGYENKQTSA